MRPAGNSRAFLSAFHPPAHTARPAGASATMLHAEVTARVHMHARRHPWLFARRRERIIPTARHFTHARNVVNVPP